MRIIYLLIILLFSRCNPFPQKDKHPDIPYLKDILNDKNLFIKIHAKEKDNKLMFLKDDRILFLPTDRKKTSDKINFKIFETKGKTIIELLYTKNKPLYLDKRGNLFYENIKYNYPDYTKKEKFETILINDSLRTKRSQFELAYPDNDSLVTKSIADYEKEISEKYGIEPCENIFYKLSKGESCDLYEYRENKLIIRKNELFKNDFSKDTESISEFDTPVIINYQGSGGDYGIPLPTHLKYYVVGNNCKFKDDNYPYPVLVKLNGEDYLYSIRHGLYKVK